MHRETAQKPDESDTDELTPKGASKTHTGTVDRGKATNPSGSVQGNTLVTFFQSGVP